MSSLLVVELVSVSGKDYCTCNCAVKDHDYGIKYLGEFSTIDASWPTGTLDELDGSSYLNDEI